MANGSMANGSNGRHAAMFLAGIAADETVGHWWLGIFGTDMLPMQFGPLTVTQSLNEALMVIWPVALVFLVWYAWFRKEKQPLVTAR
jgi:hypothetical protein